MGVKRYFRREFQLSSFGLEHESAADFYVGCFQKNRAALPLLCIRCAIFLGCLGILLASAIMTMPVIGAGLWWIFLTHWGLIFITVTSGLAFAVSVRAYLRGPIDSTFGLPWYIKAYWVSYNASVPIAFFITVFYWILLTDLDEEFAVNTTLDVLIHAINSVLMLLLVMSGRHPTRILHCYLPVLAGIVYMVFSLIYYFAGGQGIFGTGAIYPMLDWSEPGLTTALMVGSAVGLIVMHLIVVGISAARDALSKTCRDSSSTLSITNERYN